MGKPRGDGKNEMVGSLPSEYLFNIKNFNVYCEPVLSDLYSVRRSDVLYLTMNLGTHLVTMECKFVYLPMLFSILGSRDDHEEEVPCKMQIQSLWSVSDGKCVLVDRGCRSIRGR